MKKIQAQGCQDFVSGQFQSVVGTKKKMEPIRIDKKTTESFDSDLNLHNNDNQKMKLRIMRKVSTLK